MVVQYLEVGAKAHPGDSFWCNLCIVGSYLTFCYHTIFAAKPTSSTDYGCQSGSSCGRWSDGGVAGSKLEKRTPPWFKEKV